MVSDKAHLKAIVWEKEAKGSPYSEIEVAYKVRETSREKHYWCRCTTTSKISRSLVGVEGTSNMLESSHRPVEGRCIAPSFRSVDGHDSDECH